MPLLGLLESLEPFVVVDALFGSNSLKHVSDSRHHSLKTAEVDVSTVAELVEDLVGVFLNLVLDVHLATLLVLLLTGKSVVNTEVVGELLLGSLEFVIIQQSIGVGNSKEEPGLSLVDPGGRGVLGKETTDETTVGSNSGSGSNHDVVGGGVLLRHEHNLSGGSGHHDLVTGLGVAKEVGADSLLGRIVSLQLRAPVGCATHAKRSGLSGHVISVTRRGDGVKTHGVGLSVLLANTWGHNTPGLALPVREVTVVVDDDVASLACGLWAHNTLCGHNLSSERSLVLPHIHRNSGLVIVWLSLKEVLSTFDGSSKGGLYSIWHESRRRCDAGSKAKSELHRDIDILWS
mmetsp:Transcript_1215/g.880  ORF Transcript_1215/g.880 Transcript_1215/m.880 type:complete len:346 (-) Transcript_1215:11-1048(-)